MIDPLPDARLRDDVAQQLFTQALESHREVLVAVPTPTPTPTPAAKPIRSLQDTSAPPPAGFRMTIHAHSPYEAFKAAGWTDWQLLQHGYMTRGDDVLTLETLRQHLSEQCPGFTTTAATALGLGPQEFLRRVEAGEVEVTDLLVALAGPPSRPTHLGNLPITADSIDRLDKAFTDLSDAHHQCVFDLQAQLDDAHAELRTYRRVRRMLKAADGKELAEKLRALNRLLGDPRDR